MKVLVVGSGAREHAIAWKLFASQAVQRVYCAPGNIGTSGLSVSVPIQADRVGELVSWATQEGIDLVVVGPEGPLAAGLADACHEARLKVFGPSARAAQIEASKVWAKGFMERQAVPTARHASCDTMAEAVIALPHFEYPLVIKADGLAAGKGVEIATSEQAAMDTLERYMSRDELGAAGRRVVIEEFLKGQEVSVFAVCDGKNAVLLPPARDYKRLQDGDRGPNTGGMGAIAPVAEVDDALLQRIRTEIVERTLAGLEQEGRPYRGLLYAGLMLTAQGPRVLEFNCRFGDPETQVLLPLLESDLLDLLLAVPEGRIGEVKPAWRNEFSCGVVLASEGYPGSVRTGVPVDGLDNLEPGVLVFQAGTARRADVRAGGTWDSLRQGLGLAPSDADLVTAGGRVLTVVATGPSLAEAREKVYRAVEVIDIPGAQFRSDIGVALGAKGLGPRAREETPRPRATAEVLSHSRDSAQINLQTHPVGTGSASSIPTASGGGASVASEVTQSTAQPAPGPRPQTPGPEHDAPGALVAIIMGSESDREVMQQAATVLDSLGIGNEMHVMSAHRTPQKVQAFAQGAEARGIRAIIAGAGMAAHLPGVIASWTTLPVIGVPLAAGELRGLDSLYAIVQMPPGVPVATVGIGTPGARNAAYLAASILSLADDGIRQRYQEFRRKQSGA